MVGRDHRARRMVGRARRARRNERDDNSRVERVERVEVLDRIDFGLCGVAGGMMLIEVLADTMRSARGGIVAVEDDMRQTYTVKHIRKGLTLFNHEYKNDRSEHVWLDIGI